MEVPKAFLALIKENDWDKQIYELSKDDYLLRLKKRYAKTDYEISRELWEKLSLVYELKLRYPNLSGDVETLYFDSKKANKYGTDFGNRLCSKFGVRNMLYIGDIHPGYMTIWVGDQENLWGDYDKVKVFWGKGFFEGILNLVNQGGEALPKYTVLPSNSHR